MVLLSSILHCCGGTALSSILAVVEFYHLLGGNVSLLLKLQLQIMINSHPLPSAAFFVEGHFHHHHHHHPIMTTTPTNLRRLLHPKKKKDKPVGITIFPHLPTNFGPLPLVPNQTPKTINRRPNNEPVGFTNPNPPYHHHHHHHHHHPPPTTKTATTQKKVVCIKPDECFNWKNANNVLIISS